MATVIFERLDNGNVKVEIDGDVQYLPGNASVDPLNDVFINIIPPNGQAFTIKATDTITNNGDPLTGTTDAIAEVLATETFFKVAGGGNVPENVAVTDADNNFSTGQTINGTVTSKGSGGGFTIMRRDSAEALGGVWYANGGEVRLFSGTTGSDVFVIDFDKLRAPGTPSYADNAAAVAAGLPVGTIYRTGDQLKIVHS